MNCMQNSYFCFFLSCLIFVNLNTSINFGSRDSAIKFAANTSLSISTQLTVNTGTIKKSSDSSFSGAPIIFDDGKLTLGSSEVSLTGTCDFDNVYSIVLTGNNDIFRAEPGSITQRIFVYGPNNHIEGQPSFDIDFALKLQDLHTTVTLAIQSVMNSNIELNGGTIYLDDDLRFAEDFYLTGSGTIKGYGHKISIGPVLFYNDGDFMLNENSVSWEESSIIELTGNVTLTGFWEFSGDCFINGNGNILDMRYGWIRVNPGASLHLINVRLKNLDWGQLVLSDDTSQLYLCGAEIEMINDVDVITGGVYVEGTSTIITKNWLMSFAGLGLDTHGSLTVDGCVLWYDTMSYDDRDNLRPGVDNDPNQKYLTVRNGGVVKLGKSVGVGAKVLDNTTELMSFKRSNNKENNNPTRYVTITNRRYPLATGDDTISPGKGYHVTADLVFDGEAKNLIFGNSSGSDLPLITVDPGKTILFENVTLDGFSFDRVSLGEDAHMIFGDKTRVVISDPLFNLTTTMTFQGEAKLEGDRDAVLKLNSSVAGILVDRESSLRLQNITIKDVSNNQLRCLDDTGTISFGGKVTFYLDNTYDFTVGHFEIMSASMLDVRGSYSFDYHTDKQSSIYNTGTLQLSDDATFNYAPIIADNDLILFKGSDSTLSLNGGTLASTTTGMHLTVGHMKVVGEANYIIGASATSLSDGIVFGDGSDSAHNFELKFEKNGTVYIFVNPGLVVWANCGTVGTRGTEVDGNIILEDRSLATRADGRSGFMNAGTIEFFKPVTESNTKTRMDFATSIISGNAVSLGGDAAELTDKNGNYIHFKGSYNSSTQHIIPNEDSVVSQHGGLGYTIDAPAGCEIMGELLVGASPIGGAVATGLTLTDPTGIVYLSLDNSQAHIDLNGGKVVFYRSMKFSDKARFLNAGTVDLNGRSLALGGTDITWNNAIRWQNANDIVLNSKLTLGTHWYFDGDSRISGNGNVLDLTNGGTLWVRPNTTLALTNLKLKGLGTGFIVFDDTTSQLYLSNVEIEMDDDYTFTTGSIYVDGPTNFVVKNHLLIFDLLASMTIDGVSLMYDTLEFVDQNNIRPGNVDDPNHRYIAYLGNAVVRRLSFSDVLYETHYSDDVVLTTDVSVYPSKRIFFDEDLTLDGDTHMIYFSRSSESLIYVETGKQVELTNVALHDFSPSNIDLETDSSLIFGNNTVIELTKNEDLATTWTFRGSCTINGRGQVLDLGDTGNIVVDGAGSSLLFDNITLHGVKLFNVRCMDNTATISFKDTTLVLDNHYAFTVGHMDVVGKLTLQGAQTFYYATGQSSKIWSHGELMLEDDVIFRYEPPTNNRDLLEMENSKAVLYLNGATLSSSTTGIRLTKGSLIIDKINFTTNEVVIPGGPSPIWEGAFEDDSIQYAAALSEGIYFGNSDAPGNDLTVKTMPGSTLNVYTGLLVYDNRS